jgi:hypothetical protein
VVADRSLRPAALLTLALTVVSPSPSPVPLLVFAQRPDARLEVDAWNAHGERFFETRIGLADDLRTVPGAPLVSPATLDAVRFVVAPRRAVAGIRQASARPASDDDRRQARAVEVHSGGAGLALLAARCPTVWLVERPREDDLLAWALAVVLSSACLGPILDGTTRLVGAKTGRAIVDTLR